jgi:tRNA A37 threonylcarbamoyladenosine synthetase subunit TsaC/SUA5/YrdC
VVDAFGGDVAVVLDAGACDGVPSSVVDCTGETPHSLRAGPIPLEVLVAVVEGRR